MFWHMSVSLSTGGYPYPIMLCNITQNSMGQTPRGVPCQVQLGGTLLGVPWWGVPCQGVPCWGYPTKGYPAWGYPDGGTLLGVPCQWYPAWGYPVGVPCRGYSAGGYPAGSTLLGGTLIGVPCWGDTLPRGYPSRGTQVGYPPGRVPLQPGQDRGYPAGGYPVRTTEGVLTTWWAVCLLQNTFTLYLEIPRGEAVCYL